MSDPLRDAAEVMRRVRAECPWSQRITHRDLVPYLIEEAHEVIDAVENGTADELREELGDLLWQVLFHAAIAAEVSEYDIDDVARGLTEKMVRRHPHVFGDAVATTPEEVLVHWNAAKAAEKRERRSVLDGVPRGMPALALAQKLLGRASAVVPDPERPSAGVPVPERAEREEGRSGTATAPRDGGPASEAELGDALLALVSHARANGWDAERALRERLHLLEDDVRAAESGD
ncbi:MULTISPECIES: MazG family protein [unclassified Microbacterium]|uniref:MazG family protein n=1 Tax=unclassified Microbacterium TaxID=2609290 RepID=UPI0012FA19DA|nr:MazG family protein [Microbacterium sp. MAH-37]MVQ42011.1 MazG family protein [Microbacterium sp. MAH-37]